MQWTPDIVWVQLSNSPVDEYLETFVITNHGSDQPLNDFCEIVPVFVQSHLTHFNCCIVFHCVTRPQCIFSSTDGYFHSFQDFTLPNNIERTLFFMSACACVSSLAVCVSLRYCQIRTRSMSGSPLLHLLASPLCPGSLHLFLKWWNCISWLL